MSHVDNQEPITQIAREYSSHHSCDRVNKLVSHRDVLGKSQAHRDEAKVRRGYGKKDGTEVAYCKFKVIRLTKNSLNIIFFLFPYFY